MNKSQLISKIANNTKYSKTDIEKIITSMLEIIVETVANGEKVTLVGFGSFEARDRKAREGRNPKTGAKIKIDAKKVITAKVSPVFSDSVVK